MDKEKSKKCSLTDKSERESGFKVKSILTLYWILFILGGVIGVYLTHTSNSYPSTNELWVYLPRCTWILALAVIFFDSLNICFLRGSALYENLADKVRDEKLMPSFKSMCCCSGGLFLINIFPMLHYCNYSQTSIICSLCIIALAWFLTGILQLTRFR